MSRPNVTLEPSKGIISEAAAQITEERLLFRRLGGPGSSCPRATGLGVMVDTGRLPATIPAHDSASGSPVPTPARR